jgi:soluble lytic murein transglycosylase-like protein
MTQWLRDRIARAADKHGLDPQLVEAVVRAESSGNPRAYRYEPAFWDRYLKDKQKYKHEQPRRVSASYGLMQLMFPTASDELGFEGEPEDLFNIDINLDLGCALLVKNRKWGGSMEAALAAYNGGRTKDNLKPPFRNGGYVSKVMGHLADIKKGK